MHATGLAGAVVVVAKQVAEPVYGEAFKLAVQAGTACATAGSLDRNHDVAEKYAVARGIGHALEFLHMKTQHVGGAIEAAELAVEGADFLIPGEQQGRRRARAPQFAQSHAQATRDFAARGRANQAGDALSGHDIDEHKPDHRSFACSSPRPTTCRTEASYSTAK